MREIRVGAAIPRMALIPSTELIDQRSYPYDLIVVFVTGGSAGALDCVRIDFVGYGGSLMKSTDVNSFEFDERFAGKRPQPQVLCRPSDMDFLPFIAHGRPNFDDPDRPPAIDALHHYSMWFLDAMQVEVAALACYARPFIHKGPEDELLKHALQLGEPLPTDRWEDDDLGQPLPDSTA